MAVNGVEAISNPLPKISASQYHFAVRAVNDLGEFDWPETLSLQHGEFAFKAAIAST